MHNKPLLLLLSLALLSSPAALALNSKTATQQAKAFLRSMARGHFTGLERNFTQRMKRALAPKRLTAIWMAKTNRLGRFQGLGLTKVVKYQRYKIVFVKALYRTSSIWVKVVLNRSGKIAGLFFIPVLSSSP